MIHYPHIIMAAVGELWAIDEEKLRQVTAFLGRKMRGEQISAEELARITQKTQREIAQKPGQVALLPVYGTIGQRMNMMTEFSGGTSTQMLAGDFRAALADPNIKAIVFDHDSPGGTVAGTEELASEILNSRGTKPIVAQVNSLAASGSYWLASAADEIVVTPGGQAGSIGVYRIHEDITKMLESDGVRPTIIRSSQTPFKIDDSGMEPLTQDARDHIQQRVDQSYERMVRSIAAGRNATLTAVRDRFGQGRVFGAEELVSRGMADRIDTLEGTLERFGVGPFNPVANANRGLTAARAEAGNLLIAKLKARDEPSAREWEQGLEGLMGLSHSEARRAVALLKKGPAQCDAEGQTEIAVSIADFADLKSGVADIRKTLEAMQAA